MCIVLELGLSMLMVGEMDAQSFAADNWSESSTPRCRLVCKAGDKSAKHGLGRVQNFVTSKSLECELQSLDHFSGY